MNVSIKWAATGHHNVFANLIGLNNDVLSSVESAVSTVHYNDSSLYSTACINIFNYTLIFQTDPIFFSDPVYGGSNFEWR